LDKKMTVLVIGSGGREHALAWKIAQSPYVDKVVCIPGNGGTAREKKCQNINIPATDTLGLVKLAGHERFDLTVVGPEGSLVAGIVDSWPKDLRIWGPNASAARLEGSKIFAKEAMDRYSISTAPWVWFYDQETAKRWLDTQSDRDLVVKADGLTGGKGALVCSNREEIRQAIDRMSSFGEAGKRFIIEERLFGHEASLFLLCNANKQIIPLETAQDYKRAENNDAGPNTGGMGAYSPASHLTPAMITEIIAKHHPMITKVGFTGFLYIGLMLTDKEWKVLEYNVRMGDPETQAVLPRLETDLALLLYKAAGGEKCQDEIKWSKQAAVTVVMTEKGYPGDYQKGDVIIGLDRAKIVAPNAIIFHAGTILVGNEILTHGGRVLGVTALGKNVASARKTAYNAVDLITWGKNTAYRSDIAKGV